MAMTSPLTLPEWMRALAERLRPGMQWAGMGTPVRLERGEVWGRQLPGGEPVMLTCTEGLLWLTCEGDSRDFVMAPGHGVRLESAGHVVVQALRPARFCLTRARAETGCEAPPLGPEAHAS